MIGSSKLGTKTSPYAATTLRISPPKPAITNQCSTPMWLHLSIRVCPRTSLSMVRMRRPNGPLRVESGCPSRMVASMRRTVMVVMTTATAVNATQTIPRISPKAVMAATVTKVTGQ
jgi:hypothetical protein